MRHGGLPPTTSCPLLDGSYQGGTTPDLVWCESRGGTILGLGFGAAAVFFGLSFACSSSGDPDLDGGRAVASPCPTRPSGVHANDAGCMSDKECTTGLNGRCNGCAGQRAFPGGDAACPPNTCSYDECSSDETCNGFACLCADTFPVSHDGTNRCAKSGCKVNSDCSGGYACAPSRLACLGYPVGYYCRTAADTCAHDSECPGGYCAFNGSSWACANACPDS